MFSRTSFRAEAETNMSSDLSIEFRGSYLHVKLPPGFEITPEKTTILWLTIGDACQEYVCKRVLVEGTISSRQMTMADVYDSGKGVGDIGGLRLACLFYDYPSDETTDFFKMVASNHGVLVEFFNDRTEALRWLGVDCNK